MPSALPIAKSICRGKKSPKKPYKRVERATPPVQDDDMNPKITPRLFSGIASTSDALIIVLPAAVKKAPTNKNMQIGTNPSDMYARIIKRHDTVKAMAKI